MKKYILAALFTICCLYMHGDSHGQTATPQYLPSNGCTTAAGGKLTCTVVNGISNAAQASGVDICAKLQTVVTGATSGVSAQIASSGSLSCAGGVTISNPAVSIQHTSPGTITFGAQVLGSSDNLTIRGMGGAVGGATGTTWTFASGLSGTGLLIGNGVHNPQRFKMSDMKFIGNSSLTSVVKLVSTFSPHLEDVTVACAPNTLGQTGLQFDDSAAGTNGWGIVDGYASINCDVAIGIESTAHVADANHHFHVADIDANVGVYAHSNNDTSYDSLNIAPLVSNAQITAIHRDGPEVVAPLVPNVITITTTARSPEIFSVAAWHYLSITGITGTSWPMNTISTITSASRACSSICTVTVNFDYPLAVSAGSMVSIQGLTGYTLGGSDNTPNGAHIVDSVSNGGATITFIQPGTAETFTVPAGSKGAIAPFKILSVPDNTHVTVSQNGSTENGTLGAKPYVGTVGIGYMLDNDERTTISGGNVESATNRDSQPDGTMTVCVFALSNTSGLKVHNVNCTNDDWAVLDQTTQGDTVVDSATSAWSQNIFRTQRLHLGKRYAGYIDAYESGADNYMRFGCIGSTAYNIQGCTFLDSTGTPQAYIGYNGMWLPNLLRLGPYASQMALIYGTIDALYLQAPNGSFAEAGRLNDATGATQAGWGGAALISGGGFQVNNNLLLAFAPSAPCLSTAGSGKVQSGCSASGITSGLLGAAYGGTGHDNSAATGISQWASGVQSVSTALANGTTATTQSANDGSTKVATDAYADRGCHIVGTLASPQTITGTTSATQVPATPIALPVLGANSRVKVYAAIVGNAANTGTLDPAAYLGTTAVKDFSTFSLHTATAYFIGEWNIDNLGSVSSQLTSGWDNTSGSAASIFTPSATSVNTGTAQSISIKVTPSVSGDTHTVQALVVEVCQ